jgi:hypothetical protein
VRDITGENHRSEVAKFHEVVVVQFGPIVIAHHTNAVHVVVHRILMARIVGARLHKAVQRRRGRYRVAQIPIDVTLIPRRTGVLNTLRQQVKRRDWRVIWTGMAVSRRNRCRITTGIRRRRSRRNIELRQSIECLIGKSVLRPVLAQGSEVAIERTVFLRQEYDVIDRLQRCLGEGGGNGRVGRQSYTTCASSGACPGPTSKGRSGDRSGGQADTRPTGETGRARGAAVYARRTASDRALAIAGQRNC